MDDQIPNDEPNPDASELRFPITVFDAARNETIMFDGRDCRCWGPVTHGEDWNMWEGYYNWDVSERLFLHAGNPCFWTLLTERAHTEFNTPDISNVERLSADAAANWFAHNAIDLPGELAHLRQKVTFQPGAPIEKSQGDHASHLQDISVCKPKWDGERRELKFDGQVIRKLSSTATETVKIVQVFEEEGWPELIDSPWPSNEKGTFKRRDSIRTLNDGLMRIRFESDGSGEGILWKLLASEVDSTNEPQFPF